MIVHETTLEKERGAEFADVANSGGNAAQGYPLDINSEMTQAFDQAHAMQGYATKWRREGGEYANLSHEPS